MLLRVFAFIYMVVRQLSIVIYRLSESIWPVTYIYGHASIKLAILCIPLQLAHVLATTLMCLRALTQRAYINLEA
jgi:hypothetical protein